MGFLWSKSTVEKPVRESLFASGKSRPRKSETVNSIQDGELEIIASLNVAASLRPNLLPRISRSFFGESFASYQEEAFSKDATVETTCLALSLRFIFSCMYIQGLVPKICTIDPTYHTTRYAFPNTQCGSIFHFVPFVLLPLSRSFCTRFLPTNFLL